MRTTTIPLWLVFSLQSLVVALSFTALILVLVLQQQAEYKDSVFREIDLRQDVINAAMTAPIITRERIHTQLATRLELDRSLWFQYGDTMAMEHIQRFLNFTFFMIYNDPLSFTVFQYRLSPYHTVSNQVGFRSLLYGVAGITSDIFTAVTSFPSSVVAAPNPAYPLQFSATFTAPLEFKGSQNNAEEHLTKWGGIAVIVDTVVNKLRYVNALYTPLEYNHTAGATSLSLAYTIDVYYLIGLANQSLITPDTKALLVERRGAIDEIIANINVGATLYNEADVDSWNMSTFPNQDMIAQFNDVDSKCDYSLNCTKYAVDDGENIVMMQRMTTDYNFRMDFFQVTPRSFYFAAGEKTMAIGVAIGVVAAVVVLLSCVVIWFAIRGPVRQLRESMELAAVMRNDEVSDTSSVLTEINDLSQSFLQMNEKLLQARAFMPQAMLFINEDSTNECYVDDDSEGNEIVDVMVEVDETHSSLRDSQKSKLLDSPESSTRTSKHSSRRESHVIAHTLSGDGSRRQNDGMSNSGSRQGSRVRPMVETMLTSKKVGVLILNARGTHNLAVANATKLEQEQVRLVELVERCARAEKGVVDAFQGDHFVVTFNAVRAVAVAGKNGAMMALSIEEGAQREQLTLQKFSMGLSVGRALVGNVGSTTMKKNVTIGGVYTNAVGLERLAKQTDRTCVVNGRCLNDLEHIVHYMLLGSVQLSDDHCDIAACVMGVVANSSGNEEWLYHMEGKEDPFGAYNQLATLYIKRGASSAMEATTAMVATTEGPIGAASRHLESIIKRRLKRDELVSEINACEIRESLTADYDAR